MRQGYSEKTEKILSVGIDQISTGNNNWVLSYEQAIVAIGQLEEIGVGIPGADSFLLKQGQMFNAHAWFICDKKENEAYADYVTRSASEGRMRLADLHAINPEFYFSITPNHIKDPEG